MLRDDPESKPTIAGIIGSIIQQDWLAPFFAECGIPREGRLWREMFRRSVPKFGDSSAASEGLARWLGDVFGSRKELLWLRGLSKDILTDCLDLSGDADRIGDEIRLSKYKAILRLSSELMAFGSADGIRFRSPFAVLPEPPGLQLALELEFFVKIASREPIEFRAVRAAARSCRSEIARFRDVLEAGLARAPDFGMSLDLFYRIDRIERVVARCQLLLDSLEEAGEVGLLDRLIDGMLEERNAFALLRECFRAQFRGMIAEIGKAGEKYIGRTSEDFATSKAANDKVIQETNDQVLNVWLFDTPYAIVANKKVRGLNDFRIHPFGNYLAKPWWGDVWVQPT